MDGKNLLTVYPGIGENEAMRNALGTILRDDYNVLKAGGGFIQLVLHALFPFLRADRDLPALRGAGRMAYFAIVATKAENPTPTIKPLHCGAPRCPSGRLSCFVKFVVHCGAQYFGLFREIREIRGSLRGSGLRFVSCNS